MQRAAEAGFSWPLPEGLDDPALEAAVFPAPPSRGAPAGAGPEAMGYRELQRPKDVVLRPLRLEDREPHPNSDQYTWFCSTHDYLPQNLSQLPRGVVHPRIDALAFSPMSTVAFTLPAGAVHLGDPDEVRRGRPNAAPVISSRAPHHGRGDVSSAPFASGPSSLIRPHVPATLPRVRRSL